MDLNPRTQRRIDRINAEVDILTLLEGYGFRVRGDMDREQQFQCHLHGSGEDNKPSARVYPETQSWYCWACSQSRDAIATVREVERVSFIDAINWLETKFSLPPMPYLNGDAYERPMMAGEAVARSLKGLTPREREEHPLDVIAPGRTFEQDAHVVSVLLDSLTKEKILPLIRMTAYWEALDHIVFLVQGKGQNLPGYQGRVALDKIRTRVKREMLECLKKG